MSKATFLAIAAVLHGVLGLSALVSPAGTAAVFGAVVDPTAEPMVRLLGATLIGAATAFWLSRGVADAKAMQAVLAAGLVINLLSMAIVAVAITGGTMEARAWAGAAARLALAAGFGYYLIAGEGRRVASV